MANKWRAEVAADGTPVLARRYTDMTAHAHEEEVVHHGLDTHPAVRLACELGVRQSDLAGIIRQVVERGKWAALEVESRDGERIFTGTWEQVEAWGRLYGISTVRPGRLADQDQRYAGMQAELDRRAQGR